jgi:hypothetical protein
MNKKGVALILVIMVIFVSTALLILVSTTSDVDARNQVLKREKVRAEMLAKGAIQHALLKIRYFPTEFYDASILWEGDGQIGHHVIEFPDETYLGQVYQDENDGEFYCTGEFVRDLGMMMGEEMEEGFVEEGEFRGQLKTQSPYGGVYFVEKIELLSRNEANKQDTIRFTVYSKEISGFTTAVLRPSVRGTKNELNLNEGMTMTVIKELKWK